jgi:hypothetical protein
LRHHTHDSPIRPGRTRFDVGVCNAGLLWVEAELAGAPDEHLVECYDGAVGDVLRGWLARVGVPTELPL